MRWSPGGRGDIDDMRGRSGGVGVAGLGIGGFLVLLVLSWVTGTNLFSLLGTGDTAPSQSIGTSGDLRTSPAEERQVDFVGAVTKDVQDTWAGILGQRYERTRLVLFRDALNSGCGFAQQAMGPFYCPADQKVYLDLSFFSELSQRFGAPGDFAQAYVIAHEFGHHVQNLIGLSERGSRDRQTGPASFSVALELQADCFAGVWANKAQNARQILEQGDVESAMNAAAKIGDDALQRSAGRAVVPDSFTHGSSAQRQRWFATGLKNGSMKDCDTFNTRSL